MKPTSKVRHDWTFEEVAEIYERPLLSLVFDAAMVHREFFDPRKVQVSQLISIKTGGCPEDCHYCPQAARYHTGVKRHGLMEVDEVVAIAKEAKERGASRLCIGAAWREARDNAQFEQVCATVKAVRETGMEVCATLGMLTDAQAQKLKAAGLYAYNHNVDTSESHYKEIISTRTYQDRLNTLERVRNAELTVCSGGIIGMGETVGDRIGMLLTLTHLTPHPESVPINTLVPVAGTPLGDDPNLDPVSIWELVRMIATTRIVLPRSFVRLSAGRIKRSAQDQALCFMAGANSIFAGDKLLTTPNPDTQADDSLFSTLGLLRAEPYEHAHLLAECRAE